jgi:hypothetical protein
VYTSGRAFASQKPPYFAPSFEAFRDVRASLACEYTIPQFPTAPNPPAKRNPGRKRVIFLVEALCLRPAVAAPVNDAGEIPLWAYTMNQLYVGLKKEIEYPDEGYLLICDEVPDDLKRVRVFDPREDCFDPLKDITYRKAREIAEIFYSLSPQGSDTLTVRNGQRALARYLIKGKWRLDSLETWLWKKAKDEEKKFSPTDVTPATAFEGKTARGNLGWWWLRVRGRHGP